MRLAGAFRRLTGAAPERKAPLYATDLVRSYLDRTRPEAILWLSPDVPRWLLSWPGVRIVLTDKPRPDEHDPHLVWIDHDLGWLHDDTLRQMRAALAHRRVRPGFGWIDGHHALYVLLSHVRGFVEVAPGLTLGLDDAVPPDMDMAGPSWGRSDWWVGEVWALAAWLKRQRSRVGTRVYATQGTGVAFVSGLTPTLAQALDQDVIREETDASSLQAAHGALDLLPPERFGRDLRALRPARELKAKARLWTSVRDLRHEPDAAVRTLADGASWTRPPAEIVIDFSDGDLAHGMASPWRTELAAVAEVRLPPGSTVRGTLLAELPSGRLLLPRAARGDSTADFLGGVREREGVRASHNGFYAGLGRDAQGRPTLDDTFGETLDGDVLWATPDEWDNWGTWLLQAVPALVHAERTRFGGRVLCRTTRPWQKALAEAVAPTLSGRIVPHAVVRSYKVRGRLSVIAQSVRNLGVTAFERDAYAALAERALAERPQATPERVFVSRLGHSRANPAYRALRNEEALIAGLAGLGFVAVEPETLDPLSQIALFARAREVVGLGGAGMFSTVFCRAGAPVLDIESSTHWAEGHATLFASAGLRYGMIFGRRVAGELGPHAAWTTPVDETVEVARAFFA